jgi:hypothetical protein
MSARSLRRAAMVWTLYRPCFQRALRLRGTVGPGPHRAFTFRALQDLRSVTNQLFACSAGTSTACNSGAVELSTANNNATAAATIETACRTW